ncbi:polysaccharide pyruvyl transferase family protein [Candidatus Pacearchaeota archaeon]|nr:polysaccharide pyruvyl transferase family protein [Candidatus Pacearchaeota archaeon]
MKIIKNLFRKFGFFTPKDSLRVYWWSGEGNRNFGDIISPYIVKKISGKDSILVNRYCLKNNYLVTGSILAMANKNSIIWGSGIISRNQKIKKPKKIFAVRGPLSRKRLLDLGFTCPKIYGDPALLLPLFYRPNVKKKYKLGIIPHYMDYNFVKKNTRGGNILIINLLDPIEKVIKDICSCKKTISSSLHGIITSHAYSIPSMWVEFSKKLYGDGTKFKDYFLSVGIKEYEPINLRKKDIEIERLIKVVDKKHNQKIKIDINKLLDVCPFKKSK